MKNLTKGEMVESVEDDMEQEECSKVILPEDFRDDIISHLDSDSEMELARKELLEFVEPLEEGEKFQSDELIQLLRNYADSLVTPDNIIKRLIDELEGP